MSGYGYNNAGNVGGGGSSYTPPTPPASTPPPPPAAPPPPASTPPPASPPASQTEYSPPTIPDTTQEESQPSSVNETGPFEINRYYPLYNTIEGAVSASPDPTSIRSGETTEGYHIHIFFDTEYYMPNGLEMGVTQFHGDYPRGGLPNQQTEQVVVEDVQEIIFSGVQKFTFRDELNNFKVYEVGDVVLYEGEMYEVLRETYGRYPSDDGVYFIMLNKKDRIVDGGEF